MSLEVVLTEDAARDLEELIGYIGEVDREVAADRVLDRIAGRLEGLGQLPARGAPVRELATLGIVEYREVFFKPYRVIYRVFDTRVVVFVITDGQRDLQSLLERRLVQV
ncbi:type II toxin-antitoxin system RelE/ParE family toxin [Myxococcota bacterium]|nr:type II toxin-antitoxin system RelE/ParE family toxin [Myxococcota bacterium]